MKNKKVIYLLLLAALAIWGGIFYRVYQSIGSQQEESPIVGGGDIRIDTDFSNQRDTFTLSLDYPDPFAHGIQRFAVAKPIVPQAKIPTRPQRIIRQAPVTTSKVKPKKKKKVKWPKVAYKGMVSNQKTGKELILLNINQADHILAVGDTISKVKVMQVWRDSVQLQNGGERRTVYSK